MGVVFLFGATTIAAQVLLLRECLVVVAGNELFIALFFGSWFVGISVGAALGSVLNPRREKAPLLIALLLSLQVVLLPILMISVRGVRARWHLPASQFVPFFPLLAMSLFHLFPFGFLTGLAFPSLCRWVALLRRGERAIGIVYAVESAGSLAGGLLVTFVFAVYCNPLTGAWVLGAAMASGTAFFLAASLGRSGRWPAAASAVLAVGFLAILSTGLRRSVEQWAASLRHGAYGSGFEWLAETYTRYQHLALVRRGDQYSLLSNGRFVETFPNPYAVGQRVHLMMSQSERPRRLLVIGGGEGGALAKLLLYPVERIDYLQIDPAVIELVKPYLDETDRQALEDPRVHIFHEDARLFVRRRLAQASPTSRPLYDVVLCNTPDPSTAALNRFYTRDFFAQVRRLVGRSGVLVTTISSGVNYFDRELLDYIGSVYEALTESFGHVLATPGTRAFLFATASDDLLTSDVERLMARFDRQGVRDPIFSPLFFYTAYESNQLALVNRSLHRSLGSVRTNSDLEPVTYLYHLRLWNRFSGARSQRFFSLVERYDWHWVVWVCLVLLAMRLASSPLLPMTSDRAASRHGAVVLFITGVAGMVSSILLLLLFQSFHGYLYSEVGLLVALFMAGLTTGGAIANRIGRDAKGWLLVLVGGAALAYGFFFLLLELLATGRLGRAVPADLLAHPVFFFLAMVAAGILTGVQFPLVGRLAVVCGGEPGKAGGTLESLDHLGGCLGAFLTGIVLIPVSGVGATLKVFGAIEATAGLSVLLAAAMLRFGRGR